MSWWSDVVGDVEEAITSAAGGETQAELKAGGAPDVSLAGPFTGFIHVIEAIWSELTDWRMWASLGWLILGLGLMFAGVFLWMKKEGISPPIPIPVPV